MSDKSKENIILELEALNKKIKALEKQLHTKFFSSVQEFSDEDFDLISEQETDAIYRGNEKGDFILVNNYASKLTGFS